MNSNFADHRSIVLTLFMMLWMVLWWIFEVLPLGITALIPLIYLPVFNLMKIESVSALYANPVIYLFLGGFMLARGLEKTKLDERFALWTLKKVGHSDRGIIFGFVLITAFLSMWISNTATTVMMVPIAFSVLNFLKTHLPESSQKDLKAFCVVLFLSVAYSANIGGIMTPIGTPPNVVFVGYLENLYQIKIEFWKWMLVAVPLSLSVLGAMLFILRKLNPFHVAIPSEFKDFILHRYQELGKLNSSQKITLVIFFSATFLWILKDIIHWLMGFEFLNDTSIALLAGLLLFLIPFNRKGDRILNHQDISPLPWDIVLLFGGGLALAGALKEVGFINITTDFFSSFGMTNHYFLIFTMTAAALFLTEVMSNVALCVVALPMIMQLGQAQGISPLLIGLPVTIASSFAFMLPLSTPPNAIVFAAQTMTIKEMMRAGVYMNILSFFLTMSLGYWLMQLIL